MKGSLTGSQLVSRAKPAQPAFHPTAVASTVQKNDSRAPLSEAVLGLQRMAGNRSVGVLLRNPDRTANHQAPAGSLAVVRRAVVSRAPSSGIQRQPPDQQDPQVGPGLPPMPSPFMFNFGGKLGPDFSPSNFNWQVQIPGLGTSPQIPADPTQIPGQIQGLLPSTPGGPAPGGAPPMPGLPGTGPPGGASPLNLSCPPGYSNPLGLGCAPDPSAPQPSDPSLLPPLTMPSFPGLPAPAAPSLGIPPLTMPQIPGAPPAPGSTQDDTQSS
jgi:hypothetical protein